jgi:hypothetical protein
MAKLQEIVNRVLSYLAYKDSLDALEGWSASVSWSIHKEEADSPAQRLIYQIRGLLNLHADDGSEDFLKRDLAELIFPFQSVEIQAEAIYPFQPAGIRVGPSSLQVAELQ